MGGGGGRHGDIQAEGDIIERFQYTNNVCPGSETDAKGEGCLLHTEAGLIAAEELKPPEVPSDATDANYEPKESMRAACDNSASFDENVLQNVESLEGSSISPFLLTDCMLDIFNVLESEALAATKIPNNLIHKEYMDFMQQRASVKKKGDL